MKVIAIIPLALVLLFPAALVAQESVPPELDDAVARGLDYLARQQNLDGSFSAGRSPEGSPAATSPPMATTGLALLAFLSAGHVPDVGRHGLVVRNAIDLLVAKVPENGYVAEAAGMYGHGIVTLALAEAYGVENDPQRLATLRAAVGKLLAASLTAQAVQKSEVHAGGWGEAPDSRDSNLWVTGWNVLALVACRDAGFDVPPEAAARAKQYVLKCRNPLDRGFAFQPGGRGDAATTAIGIVCLNLLLDSPTPELRDARRFLAQAPPATQPVTQPATQPATQPSTVPSTVPSTNPTTQPAAAPAGAAASRFPLYSAWCAMQADLQSDPPAWKARALPVLDAILKSQAPDGGWSPQGAAAEEPGRSHATALSVLTLTVPYRLLPLYPP